MDDLARVVLALETPDVLEEVLHFLDRSGRARVAGTAADPHQLAEAVRQLDADAIVAEPSLVRTSFDGPPLLALSARETVVSLRAAVHARAAAYFVWPAEREGLLDAVAATVATRRVHARRASVVSVHAARGGAGCTFVATHLADALARRGASCVLIDADFEFADVTHALGAPGDVRTIADLAPVADELTWAYIEDVLWRRALLAPPVESLEAVTGALLREAIDVASTSTDVVVVHTSRALDERTRACLEHADRVVEVLTLDVLSFRASARALELLAPLALGERVSFVVNRGGRSDLAPSDVRRVFGVDPASVVPFDAGAARAQDHGHLLSARGRVGRSFDRLAAAIVEPVPDSEGDAA
jgi:Flp pilus assembly CpaE family ATPase